MKKRKGKKLMKFQYLLCIYYWTEKSWFSNTGGETMGDCAIALGTPRSISSKLKKSSEVCRMSAKVNKVSRECQNHQANLIGVIQHSLSFWYHKNDVKKSTSLCF